MQKVYIPGCAEALHKFVSAQIEVGATNSVNMISRYANDKGMSEWADVADVTCTHAIAVAPRINETKSYVQLVCEKQSENDLIDKLSEQFVNVDLCAMENVPDLIVSVLVLRPISDIEDLAWANYKKS